MIPYGRQSISQNEIDAVVDVLRSDFLTQGPVVPRFEASVATFCDAPFAVAMNSATSALHAACLALELGPGDLLWTVPNTFVASANCGRYCGAEVDFVDIDEYTWNIDVSALAAKLHTAESAGRLPKIVVPVHFAGQSCDMRAIRALSQQYGFRVVEDASHAIGGSYASRPVGSCEFSDITVFSFHPVKIITSAEGGMAMTRDADLALKMQELRSHGITRDPARMRGDSAGGWDYQQLSLGYNYRLTDVHAALGLAQMQRMTGFVARRRELVARYDELLADLPVIVPGRQADADPAWHLYVIRVPGRRREIFDALRNGGIGVNVHYIPVHLQPYYQALGFQRGDFPVSEGYYEQAITLPLYPDMTNEQQDQVVDVLMKALQEYPA